MKVKTVAPPGAKIMFVGEAPGEKEDITGIPFHPEAPAGSMLDKLLSNAGLSRYEVILTNVARERPPGNRMEMYYEDSKMLNPKPVLKQWIEELKQDIILYKPHLVVGLGRHALYALTGEDKIGECRGYVMPCKIVHDQKVLCTYHPQKINYEWNLGFTTVMDFRKAVRESKSRILRPDPRSLNAFPSRREFIDFIQFLRNDHEGPVSLDIETTPTRHIDILGLAANPNLAISYTFLRGGKPTSSPGEEFQLWRLLAQLFREKSIIMQNGLFDTASMWYNVGVLCTGWNKDTMLAAHVCWPEAPRSLAYLSSICLSVPRWKQTAQDTPTIYNAEDVANTYGCWNFLAKEMDKHNHWDTFNFEMRQVWPASMLQLQGIEVNAEVQRSMIAGLRQEIKGIYDSLVQQVGRSMNFRSSQQLQKLLYEDLKLPVQYKRRKSRYEPRKVTTNAEALTNLFRKTNNPILEQILHYKKRQRLLTFIDIEPSPEGKVHTSYNITGATMQREKKGLIIDDEEQYRSFGRWSSSGSIILPYGSGNLQNIPEEARRIYTAPAGYSYVQADYMQAEAVVVSYEINDIPMVRLFQESFGLSSEERKDRNLDIHKLTAARNFQIPIAKVTKSQREIGKTIRHATSYSAGPKVLSNKLGCTMAQAKALLNAFHDGCPQLRIWHGNIQQLLRKNRTLTNLLGRKHKFLRGWGDDLFRSAYSYIPQSTVGDLLNLALIRLYEAYGDKLTIALQLHDAIYCIVPDDLIDWCCTVMKQSMLIPLVSRGQQFYIDVDFKVGPSWGELTDYTPTFTHEIALQ